MSTKDLKSKPKTGRGFPIEFNQVVRLVNKYGLKMTYLDERVRVRFKNVDTDVADSKKLLRFYPGDCVTIYSFVEKDVPKLKFDVYESVLQSIRNYRVDSRYSRNVDTFIEAQVNSLWSEVLVNEVTLHLQSKLDFQNKASNRATTKIIKSEFKLLAKIGLG